MLFSPRAELLLKTDAFTSMLCPSAYRLESSLKVETPFEELSELEKDDYNKRAEVKRLKKEAKTKAARQDEQVDGSLNPLASLALPSVC